MISLDTGVFITVAIAVIGAWWAILVVAMRQFERRQDEKFGTLQDLIGAQDREHAGHHVKQESIMGELRKLEMALAQSQVDAATRFQTKDDAGNQFGQLITEIRALGGRIDALHSRTQ